MKTYGYHGSRLYCLDHCGYKLCFFCMTTAPSVVYTYISSSQKLLWLNNKSIRNTITQGQYALWVAVPCLCLQFEIECCAVHQWNKLAALNTKESMLKSFLASQIERNVIYIVIFNIIITSTHFLMDWHFHFYLFYSDIIIIIIFNNIYYFYNCTFSIKYSNPNSAVFNQYNQTAYLMLNVMVNLLKLNKIKLEKTTHALTVKDNYRTWAQLHNLQPALYPQLIN